MSVLTQDRSTPRLAGDMREGDVAANALIHAGAIVVRGADGFLREGQEGAGLVGVGCAEERVDNRGGVDGDKQLSYRSGIFRYANSAGGDEITSADIGQKAYLVDDQTVAKTNGTGARSPAGFVDGLDVDGVWVRFDEALTNIS